MFNVPWLTYVVPEYVSALVNTAAPGPTLARPIVNGMTDAGGDSGGPCDALLFSTIGLPNVKVSAALATPMTTMPLGTLCGAKLWMAASVTVVMALPQVLLPFTLYKAPVPPMPEPVRTRFCVVMFNAAPVGACNCNWAPSSTVVVLPGSPRAALARILRTP